MAVSKKVLKRQAKAAKHVTAKAKKKVKKSAQIQARAKVMASKRKATELTTKEDKLDRIKSVDELLQSDIFNGEDDDPVEEGDKSDDESSGGAFCDVDDVEGDDDDAGVPDFDLGVGAMHEKELASLKESDPSFYKYLVENDRQLLDFRAPEDEAAEDDAEEKPKKKRKKGAAEEDGEDGDQAAAPAAPEQKLNIQRLQSLHDAAKVSQTAFKAVLTSYHAAVKSLEGGAGAADDEDYTKMSKSKKRRKRYEQGLLHIEDEAAFSLAIEFAIANYVGLMRHHAGELQKDGPKSGKAGKRGGKHQKADSDASLPEGMVDPTKFQRWPRIRILANMFFGETLKLLNHLVVPEMIEFVLRHISTEEALCWLWPFKAIRQKILRKCCSFWATSSTHSIRLTSFLFVRNAAAMALAAPDLGGSKVDPHQPEFEVMVRTVLKAFAEATVKGYGWLSVSTFRFMENCFVELLRLDDDTAYRIGYACIRQLALILRNACVATSQGGEAKGWKTDNKKRKSQQQQHIQNLVGWPFVRSAHLWTRAVGALPCLRPLAHPLTMVLTGALKTKLGSVQYFPFVYHLFRCLNLAAASLEAFIPVSAHLLKAFSGVLPAVDKAYRKRKTSGGGSAGTVAKAPELEVLLRFSEGILLEVMTLETMGISLCFLLTEHLGLLARSPAFPELVAPVLHHLKKHSKHCRSEPIRKHLKQTCERLEDSVRDIRARREALTEVPCWTKFFVFPADSAIAKARTEALSRKERDERARVEADLKPEPPKRPEMELDDEKEPKKLSKKEQRAQAKAEKEARKAAKEAEREAGPKPIPRAPEIGEPGKDVVEEMGFESGEDE